MIFLSLGANVATAGGPINIQRNNVFNNIYLKASLGKMKFEKFQATDGGYAEKPPESTILYGLGIGYKLTDSISVDINFQHGKTQYKESSPDDTTMQKIKITTGFINANYIFNFYKRIKPYLTGGIGISKNHSGDFDQDPTFKGSSQIDFAWNIGTGLQYELNKSFTIDFGYRYLHLGSMKTDSAKIAPTEEVILGKQTLKGHQIITALIYNL